MFVDSFSCLCCLFSLLCFSLFVSLVFVISVRSLSYHVCVSSYVPRLLLLLYYDYVCCVPFKFRCFFIMHCLSMCVVVV